MDLEALLPASLRGTSTTITPLAGGLSGAGVYRVDAGGQAFVLKIAPESEPEAEWRRALQLQRLAADAGLAPRVIHADEAHRAVVTDFVVNRSFVAFFRDPATHEAALAQLGRTVRRIHALPIPKDAPHPDVLGFLRQTRDDLVRGFALPAFATAALERIFAEVPPPLERPLVLGHNDLNPGNLVYDGASIVLLDWATAAPMEPFHDLATLAVFLRMDEGTCLKLLSAYQDAPVARLPERFSYARRLVATLAGAMQLLIARRLGHAGSTGADSLETALSLGEFYRQMQAGALRLGTAEGNWAFGLSLLRESAAL